MRSFVVLAVLVAGITAVPAPNKQRAFSLFSVVSFPNEECTTTSSSSLNGVCKTAEECTNSGGTSMGNCASGFGICCLHKTDTCSSSQAIKNNVTYLLNQVQKHVLIQFLEGLIFAKLG